MLRAVVLTIIILGTIASTVAGSAEFAAYLEEPACRKYDRSVDQCTEGISYPRPEPGSGQPAYPWEERRAGHQGLVRLYLCISTEGRATVATIETSSGFPALDESALDWAKSISWSPGRLNGNAVPICFIQPFQFRVIGSPKSESLAGRCIKHSGADGRTIEVCYPRPLSGSLSPPYPDKELLAGHKGKVILSLCFDKTGAMTRATVVWSTGYPALDDAAIEWAKSEKWTPATRNGAPVALCFEQPLSFD